MAQTKKSTPKERQHNVMLRISASHDGFRRAGRAWSKDPVDVDASEFDDEQLAQLKTEPLITVIALGND